MPSCEEEARVEELRQSPVLDTQDNEWLLKLTSGLNVDDTWFKAVNAELPTACRRLKTGFGIDAADNVEVNSARERVFGYLGLLNEDHELYRALQSSRKKNGLYPRPAICIENARLLSSLDIDVLPIFKGSHYPLRIYIDLDAERQKWHEYDLQASDNANVTELPEATETMHGLARVLHLGELLPSILMELPALVDDNRQRQIVMARAAIELFHDEEFGSATTIAQFLQKSPEVILSVGIQKDEASLADIETFIDASLEQILHRNKDAPLSVHLRERRKALLETLSNPNYFFSAIESAAVNSYFMYAPATEGERSRYAIANVLSRLHEKDQPKLEWSDFSWIRPLVGCETELNRDWLRRMNLIAITGSYDPRSMGGVPKTARELFYSYLGLNDEVVKRSRDFPIPAHFIEIVELFRDYGITNIDQIAYSYFRIFTNSKQSTEMKLQKILAKDYDFTTFEVQRILPRLLSQEMAFIEERVPVYKPGICKDLFLKVEPGKRPPPILKKKMSNKDERVAKPKKRTERARKSNEDESTPQALTLESWRRMHTTAQVEADLTSEHMALGSLMAVTLDSDRSPSVLAGRFGISRLTLTQVKEVSDFIETAGSDLTAADIRAKISTLEF